jgi:hypothetical protein
MLMVIIVRKKGGSVREPQYEKQPGAKPVLLAYLPTSFQRTFTFRSSAKTYWALRTTEVDRHVSFRSSLSRKETDYEEVILLPFDLCYTKMFADFHGIHSTITWSIEGFLEERIPALRLGVWARVGQTRKVDRALCWPWAPGSQPQTLTSLLGATESGTMPITGPLCQLVLSCFSYQGAQKGLDCLLAILTASSQSGSSTPEAFIKAPSFCQP